MRVASALGLAVLLSADSSVAWSSALTLPQRASVRMEVTGAPLLAAPDAEDHCHMAPVAPGAPASPQSPCGANAHQASPPATATAATMATPVQERFFSIVIMGIREMLLREPRRIPPWRMPPRVRPPRITTKCSQESAGGSGGPLTHPPGNPPLLPAGLPRALDRLREQAAAGAAFCLAGHLRPRPPSLPRHPASR